MDYKKLHPAIWIYLSYTDIMVTVLNPHKLILDRLEIRFYCSNQISW